MPTKKAFTKFLAGQTKGIDGQTSALEDDSLFVNRAVNYEMAVGNSARGRVGCQTSGSYGFFAIFPYRYTRTEDQYDITYQVASGTYPTQVPGLTTTKTVADGASIERLIALNEQVWILDTMNVVATYVSGSYPFTWYTTVGSNTINFIIKSAGSAILTQSISNGLTTLTNGANRTIYELVNIIDALSQFSIATTRGVRPPFALVNGNQTSVTGGSVTYGTTQTVTVNAGHTFQAGDVISAVISSQLFGGIVVSTTGLTITYVGPSFSVLDNQILGYMAQATSSFPITSAATAVSGNLTFSFPYWRLVPGGDKNFFTIFNSAHSQWGAKANPTSFGISGNFYAPAVAENALGNSYIAASGLVSDGSTGYANNLIRVDGLSAGRAGLPLPTTGVTAFVPSGGGGGLTGAYKYKFLFRRYDAQGNIWDGPDTSAYSATLSSDYVTVNIPTLQGYGSATGFLVRSGIKHTTESPAAGASFYVDDLAGGTGNTAFIQPGDPICLLDNTAQKTGLWKAAFGVDVVGTLHKTVCTDYSAKAATISPTTSSIRVADSSGYQINSDTPISCGMTLITLRTTAGGNQFYVLCEMPFSGYGSYSFIDNVTDAVLSAGEQFLEPDIGKEHDAPPPCTLVCQHQGGLVVARGPDSPNTVSFSTADGLEYFPEASNSFDVPSSRAGFITAIASDTDDRLSVFKERAYYDVLGDLDGGTISINVINEGDYGITSQASLIRTPLGLTGLSKNGWVVISDGALDPFRFMEINARVINQKYQFAWAIAVNDSFNRNYLCTIPLVSGEPVGYTIDYSRPIIRAFERSYDTQLDQGGGGAMIGDTLYHLSLTSPYGVFRRLQRFDGDSPTGNDGDSFIDNVGPISYILESAPYSNDNPETLRSYNKFRVYSIPNDYVQEGWVPFSMLVETGASSFANYIGSPNPQATFSTITFSDNSVEFKDIDLVRNKVHFYMVRFTTNTIRTAPFLTGYALLLSENYNPEDLIRG